MKTYRKNELDMIAYPLGGMGAGMFCVEGTGMLGHFSLRNEPDIYNEPNVFSALCVLNERGDSVARVLEGPVPYRKVFSGTGKSFDGAGNGLYGKNYGLPRMQSNTFTARFPFAELRFEDEKIPLQVSLTAFSPFIPLNEDDSSLPAAGLEYTFHNATQKKVRAVYSFNAFNFMNVQKHIGAEYVKDEVFVLGKHDGFVLTQPSTQNEPWAEGYFYACVEDACAAVNTNWFDGGWFDILTMLWNDIQAGVIKNERHPGDKSPGGSVAVPFELQPGESKTIVVKAAWYVPKTRLRRGWEESADGTESCCCAAPDACAQKPTHVPWYAGRFASADEVMQYFSHEYHRLRRGSKLFSDTFYDSDLPEVIIDSIAVNLTILKSPTVLRQTDGRIWAWEGCCDTSGCCDGSCNHVWNYAQAMCHLFPAMERSLRVTEFGEDQDENGHQCFRSSLPIRPTDHSFHAAADGQLGGIIKMYREWRVCGDLQWIAGWYDRMADSLEYCIRTWDPDETGALLEPHHNTYDIEFWGADGMCTSFYTGALAAMTRMGEALGKDVGRYRDLYKRSRQYLDTHLFNGEYYDQKVAWKNLRAPFDVNKESKSNAQCRRLLEEEGPKYQYGKGCMSDGVLGAWLAQMSGLGEIMDAEKVKSHLRAIFAYNFKTTLREHANPQRPGYAVGDEAGLLLCSWPNGEKPSLPFVYSDEVWTGIEHQAASHMMHFGMVQEALAIEEAVRGRYDGVKRNPFNEYECGHWYARAMASYGLLQGLTGVRYDAVTKTLYVGTQNGGRYRTFLCTATGYGTVTVCDGKAAIFVAEGFIDCKEIVFNQEVSYNMPEAEGRMNG